MRFFHKSIYRQLPVISILLFCLIKIGNAQDTLTLQEAISITLKSNHGIKVVQNEIKISQNNARAGNAGLLPKLDLSGGGNMSINNTKIEFSGAIPDIEEKGAKSFTYNGSASLNYTLFDGLGRFNSLKKLRALGTFAEAEARLEIEAGILQTAFAFLEVARQHQATEVAGEALSISLERVERAKIAYEYGAGNKLDMLNAEVDLNADSVNYLTAHLNLQNAKRELNQLLGRDARVDFEVQGNISLKKKFNPEELRKKAAKNNAAILLSEVALNISERDLNISKSLHYPRIDVSASYDYIKQTNDAGLILSNRNAGFNGGVAVSYNIFDGFRKNIQVQNAKIEIENNKERYAEAQKAVMKDFEAAYANLENSLTILSMQQKNLQTAILNFEKTKETFDRGQATGTQFREAQLNLTRAKFNISNSTFNAKAHELDVLRISGELISGY